MASTYKIILKKDRCVLLASGFYSVARAQNWIDNFDPKRYSDKTMKKEDLEILPEVRNG